jgi:hypothetical protein
MPSTSLTLTQRVFAMFTGIAGAVVGVLLAGCQPIDGNAPHVIITEVMSSNASFLEDKDGDFEDWIEIHNPTSMPITLEGYGLSDDETRPYKWTFPYLVLPAGRHLTVFASNKDRKNVLNPLHTNFKLKSAGETILLTHKQGRVLDKVQMPSMPPNLSWGRSTENWRTWLFFHEASPNAANPPTGWTHPRLSTQPTHPQIHEILANNKQSTVDEDGELSDWVELYNPSDQPLSLRGYTLSDDFHKPAKWRFPDVTIPANGYLLVFASGKDRNKIPLHTNFRIRHAQDIVVLSSPKGEILQTVPLAHQRADESFGAVEKSPTLWLHYPTPPPPQAKTTQGFTDDRSNAPIPPKGLFINEVMSLNRSTVKDDDGQYSDWLELINTGEQKISLKGVGLTDDQEEPFQFTFSGGEIGPGETLLVWLSGKTCQVPECVNPHAPFALNPSGEEIMLTSSTGRVLDLFVTGHLEPDVSSGRSSHSGFQRVLFQPATPHKPNGISAFGGYAPAPLILTPGGYQQSPIQVKSSSPIGGGVMHYTLDGSTPDASSPRVTGPIHIAESTVLKVRLFTSTHLPSPTATQTYLFEPRSELTTVTLSADPVSLFHPTRGIHSKGVNASPDFPHVGANFWKKTEIPAHVELYEPNGIQGLSLDLGFRIFGAFSRGMPKKSFLLISRSAYERPEFTYPLFPDKDLNSFKSIVIRQSGQDATKSRFRDVLMTQLISASGVDYQANRPIVLYINGQYWGIYNIREKINAHFIANNHGIAVEDVNLLRANGAPDHGVNVEYHRMVKFLRENDMSKKGNWQHIQQEMDVQNFIDYQFFQFYFANPDNGNIRFWKENGKNGKWRWILYDMDWGFHDPTHPTLKFITNPEGTGASKAFSTSIITSLLANEEFKDLFLKRAAFHLNHTFRPERVLTTIHRLAARIEPEIERDRARWDRTKGKWEQQVGDLRKFAERRPKHARSQLKQFFGLSEEDMRAYSLVPREEQ